MIHIYIYIALIFDDAHPGTLFGSLKAAAGCGIFGDLLNPGDP